MCNLCALYGAKSAKFQAKNAHLTVAPSYKKNGAIAFLVITQIAMTWKSISKSFAEHRARFFRFASEIGMDRAWLMHSIANHGRETCFSCATFGNGVEVRFS